MESEELLKMSYEINWEFDRVCGDMSVEELWDEVHGKYLSITKQVPQVGPDKRGGIDTYNMLWIKSSLKRALRARSKAWCTFDEFPTISNLNLALFKNQNFENLETKAKLRYEKVITNDFKHNSKAF